MHDDVCLPGKTFRENARPLSPSPCKTANDSGRLRVQTLNYLRCETIRNFPMHARRDDAHEPPARVTLVRVEFAGLLIVVTKE